MRLRRGASRAIIRPSWPPPTQPTFRELGVVGREELIGSFLCFVPMARDEWMSDVGCRCFCLGRLMMGDGGNLLPGIFLISFLVPLN